jgi:hypothetical protein
MATLLRSGTYFGMGENYATGCPEQHLGGLCGKQPEPNAGESAKCANAIVFGVEDQLRRGRSGRPGDLERPGGELGGPGAVIQKRE